MRCFGFWSGLVRSGFCQDSGPTVPPASRGPTPYYQRRFLAYHLMRLTVTYNSLGIFYPSFSLIRQFRGFLNLMTNQCQETDPDWNLQLEKPEKLDEPDPPTPSPKPPRKKPAVGSTCYIEATRVWKTCLGRSVRLA